jgi:hypothetical protein
MLQFLNRMQAGIETAKQIRDGTTIVRSRLLKQRDKTLSLGELRREVKDSQSTTPGDGRNPEPAVQVDRSCDNSRDGWQAPDVPTTLKRFPSQNVTGAGSTICVTRYFFFIFWALYDR